MFRAESGRCVGALVRILGDIDAAEDAVQEAFVAALRTWPTRGWPDNPGAWITTTARNRAIDRLRRGGRGVRLSEEALAPDQRGVGVETIEPRPDDLLRLAFTSCHPSLSVDAQVALTLRLVAGLSTDQVARAFLVTSTAMAQRLVRAKRKIRQAHVPYRVPEPDEMPLRLPPVLAVVYLAYAAEGDDLRAEAIHLARQLVDVLGDEPEVVGLLALLLLTEARWPARRGPSGRLVLLRDQDRSTWDRGLVAEGQALVRTCLEHGRPGPYQVQAVINAIHTDADRFQDTDWTAVVANYDHLLSLAPSPVVELNRAIAVGEVDGADVALAIVDGLALEGYQPFHATRADLLARVGRDREATTEYRRAAALADDPAVRRHLADHA